MEMVKLHSPIGTCTCYGARSAKVMQLFDVLRITVECTADILQHILSLTVNKLSLPQELGIL